MPLLTRSLLVRAWQRRLAAAYDEEEEEEEGEDACSVAATAGGVQTLKEKMAE